MTERQEGSADRSGQPGLETLRAAVARYAAKRLPGAPEPRKDAVAGLNVTIANVPDGLANGLLVGVNPVFGLYATMAGPLVGGLFSSTRLMVVTTTAAASLTAGQSLSTIPAGSREGALFLMVVLVGVIQIAFGALGFGRLTRFVSYSVTTGFLTGVALLLVLGQLPTMAGVEVSGGNRVAQTLDLLARTGEIQPWSLGLAALALLLAVLLPRTPLGSAGRLLAVLVPSALLVAPWVEGVRTVADIGEIPGGWPMPEIPSFFQAFDVLTGALSVAVVILVQGTGVSQSVPNPDGTRSRSSRDFIAQGAANVASGLFRGLPVGGSVSATALNVVSGARTRWAAVFAGVWMAAIVIGVPGLVGYVAMPALGALLVLVGVSSVNRPRSPLSGTQAGRHAWPAARHSSPPCSYPFRPPWGWASSSRRSSSCASPPPASGSSRSWSGPTAAWRSRVHLPPWRAAGSPSSTCTVTSTTPAHARSRTCSPPLSAAPATQRSSCVCVVAPPPAQRSWTCSRPMRRSCGGPTGACT